MAFELLLDPEVQIVTLVGQAGTAKTLLAIAAGLHSVLQNRRYDNIPVTRPIMPLGRDIGCLPGPRTRSSSTGCSPSSTTRRFA